MNGKFHHKFHPNHLLFLNRNLFKIANEVLNIFYFAIQNMIKVEINITTSSIKNLNEYTMLFACIYN